LKWATRGITDAAAVDAFVAFTAGQDDYDLEILLGKVLVVLDGHGIFPEA
jgi:hypothetical protein